MPVRESNWKARPSADSDAVRRRLVDATEDLIRDGARHRDLVEANHYGGKILQKRQEQAQERGRGGPER